MTTLAIVSTVLGLWSILGFVYYGNSLKMVGKAWEKEKYKRVILFIILCGPIVMVTNVAIEIKTILNVVRSYILQELPDEKEE